MSTDGQSPSDQGQVRFPKRKDSLGYQNSRPTDENIRLKVEPGQRDISPTPNPLKAESIDPIHNESLSSISKHLTRTEKIPAPPSVQRSEHQELNSSIPLNEVEEDPTVHKRPNKKPSLKSFTTQKLRRLFSRKESRSNIKQSRSDFKAQGINQDPFITRSSLDIFGPGDPMKSRVPSPEPICQPDLQIGAASTRLESFRETGTPSSSRGIIYGSNTSFAPTREGTFGLRRAVSPERQSQPVSSVHGSISCVNSSEAETQIIARPNKVSQSAELSHDSPPVLGSTVQNVAQDLNTTTYFNPLTTTQTSRRPIASLIPDRTNRQTLFPVPGRDPASDDMGDLLLNLLERNDNIDHQVGSEQNPSQEHGYNHGIFRNPGPTLTYPSASSHDTSNMPDKRSGSASRSARNPSQDLERKLVTAIQNAERNIMRDTNDRLAKMHYDMRAIFNDLYDELDRRDARLQYLEDVTYARPASSRQPQQASSSSLRADMRRLQAAVDAFPAKLAEEVEKISDKVLREMLDVTSTVVSELLGQVDFAVAQEARSLMGGFKEEVAEAVLKALREGVQEFAPVAELSGESKEPGAGSISPRPSDNWPQGHPTTTSASGSEARAGNPENSGAGAVSVTSGSPARIRSPTRMLGTPGEAHIEGLSAQHLA